MSVMRSEKPEGTETESDGNVASGTAAATEVEAGIREFVRNDIAYLRRPGGGEEPNPEATASNLNSLIQRVAGTSLSEITNLISELEGLREWLHAEGQRVQREIAGYAHLSQTTIKSTRMIADNVAQWKRAADGMRNG
jgi:hypothetical protein